MFPYENKCFQQPPLREKVKIPWEQTCGNQLNEILTVIQITAFKYWYNRISSFFQYLYTLSLSIAQDKWKKAI